MAVRVGPPGRGLHGALTVPGDKSIAHRALLLAALAEGTTTVTGFSGGADVLATLGAIGLLGARGTRVDDVVRITGAGLGLGLPGTTRIDCANSGTTMRLVAGLAAAGRGTVVLDGDASLRRRPMERVAAPLRALGARIETSGGRAPVTVEGTTLTGSDVTLPVASAQLKSATLLAGLRARGTTRVLEPLPSRDHTERMLPSFGIPVTHDRGAIAVEGGGRLIATDVPLPGDASSAAFLVVAALLVPGSDLLLRDVGTNPTRTGFLDVLRRMGARIDVLEERTVAGEPRATLRVRATPLRATTITAEEVPATIDELPVLCMAAALAEGETTLVGAGELRVKESDRLAALEQLGRLGVAVQTTPDGLAIRGTAGRRLTGARIDAGGDHRIAMAFGVAGLMAEGGVEVVDPDCVEVSFPGFFARLDALGAAVEAE